MIAFDMYTTDYLYSIFLTGDVGIIAKLSAKSYNTKNILKV